MNYGKFGRELLLELKRTDTAVATSGNDALNSIPAYNDLLVSSALQDLRLHVQALNEQVEAASKSSRDSDDGKPGKPSMEIRPSLMLQEAAIQRNKRCLLAYHLERLKRIQQVHYWQSSSLQPYDDGDVGDGDGDNSKRNHIKNLCPAEMDFLEDYNSVVSRYVESLIPSSCAIDDLRTYAVVPPLTVDRVVVRVVDETPFNSGPVVLESGQTANFTIGSTHYLQYTDCESYVRAGALQMIDTEEQEG